MSETQTRRYTHIVKRQSGYMAGWHHSREEAVAFEAECNFAVPGDPAHTEELDGDEAWDGLVAEAAERQGVPVAEILARYPETREPYPSQEYDDATYALNHPENELS